MTLHTVNKSPFERNALESCLRHALDGSVVVLLEDGVYGAARDTAFSEKLARALDRLQVFVLAPDVDARGLRGKLMDRVHLIDYGGFVDLAVQHHPIVPWL